MNESSATDSGPQRIANQLLEQTGILKRAQIIADLNLEKGKEQTTFDEVIAAIQNDPLLAKRVIFLANSAWFGGRTKVDKVDVAFGRLGTTDFYKASVAAALRFHLGDGAGNDHWWEESETIAHVCEITVQQLNPSLVEAAFFAGLFRDCAVPLMSKHLADYSYLAEDALGFSPGSVDIELECNQTDHGTVGATIVRALKFPAIHATAIQHHHAQTLAAVEDPEAKQLLAILLLGGRIHAWSDKPVGAFHSETAEDALLSEIAIAFRVTKAAIDDTIVELLRLYDLREAHS